MDQQRQEIIRESFPNNIRTHTIADAENAEFKRTGPDDEPPDGERRERMDIEGAVAALAFDKDINYDDPKERHRLLNIVDKHGSIAEDRRELENEVYTDNLTRLKNEKAFNLAREHESEDNGRSYITLDIDSFGQVNKIKGLGWTIGNEGIVYTANHLRSIGELFGIDERDIFRLHGDEFVVIAPSEIAEDVLAAIEEGYGDNGDGEQKYKSDYGSVVTSITGVVVEYWSEADDALNEKKEQKKA